MNEKELSVVLLEMVELQKKFGQEKAFKILECITSIHKATEPFSQDVKEDAIQWVLDLAKKTSQSTSAKVPTDKATGQSIDQKY